MPAVPSCHRARARLAVSGCLLAALGFGVVAAAQTPGVAPPRATVYIRLFGDLELVRQADAFGPERRMDATNVEVSTGSGVLISPIGHVLTAAHVVAPGTTTGKINGESVSVKRTVRRIEVQMPPDEGGGSPVPRLEATVLATDASLDLAVLSVSGSNLPFLDLGDSDALGVGDPVEAVGFPFGDEVEIGRASTELAAVPSPSVSRGNLAAVRGDEQGDRRYLQVTVGLNPGNSGGPIVDGDGYVIAIANSVMRSPSGVGAGVGFGVPVNLVKRFLESNGLDSVLRARRLTAGGLSALEGKGLRVALPLGMSDSSPYRARVDTGQQPDPGVTFRVDRVLSPWPAARLESALVSDRLLEPFVASGSPSSQAVDTPGGRLLIGRVSGVMTSSRGDGAPAGTPVRIDYAIAERGGEKVIARFIGPPFELAYNALLVRSALRQMEVDALRSSPPVLQSPAAWIARNAPRGTPLDRLSLPSGWLQEPSGPLPCAGVPAPSDVLSASPAGDFAVALRAGWIPSAMVTLQAAAAACGTPARDDDASYSRRVTFLGTSYVVEGRFRAAAGQSLVQMEWIAPGDEAAAMRPIFAAAWPPAVPPAFQSR